MHLAVAEALVCVRHRLASLRPHVLPGHVIGRVRTLVLVRVRCSIERSLRLVILLLVTLGRLLSGYLTVLILGAEDWGWVKRLAI